MNLVPDTVSKLKVRLLPDRGSRRFSNVGESIESCLLYYLIVKDKDLFFIRDKSHIVCDFSIICIIMYLKISRITY